MIGLTFDVWRIGVPPGFGIETTDPGEGPLAIVELRVLLTVLTVTTLGVVRDPAKK